MGVVSCAQGYDVEDYSGGVTNAQLESPDPTKITVTTVTNAAGEQVFKIEWPVVYGAGGYEFTMYNVDDPDNPLVVGEANEIIDGCSVQRAKAEDTNYNIVIKTLGNEQLNNKAALEAAELAYSTWIPVYTTIPSGTNLTTYFAQNPVPDYNPEELAEVIYSLEAEGEYTMNGDVDLKYTNVSLRGDKIYRPKVTVSGDASFVSEGAGFKVRLVDFDLTNYEGSGFIQYKSTINTANPRTIYYNDDPWIVIEDASGLESCNITGLKNSLIKDNGKKYASRSFTFNDCVVEQAATAINPFINLTGAIIKELSMNNSTFYCLNKDYGSNWIVYANVRVIQVADRVVWATEKGSININNSTLWQIAYAKQIFNSNGWAQTSNSVTLQNSIFVDTANKEINRRIRMSSANVSATFANNTYWYDGAFADNEVDHDRGDKTGTEIRTDPQLKNPANGDFTVQGSEQISRRTGDPRWLPAE